MNKKRSTFTKDLARAYQCSATVVLQESSEGERLEGCDEEDER
jgi:hypothetical protein